MKKINIKKGAIALALVSTILVTTTGCADAILEDTILEKSCVVTFADGSKDIAVACGKCCDSEYSHYRSAVSGLSFSDEKCNHEFSSAVHYYDIVNEEPIAGYLTTDELAKAMKGELTEDDVAVIVSRAIKPIAEEVNDKSR